MKKYLLIVLATLSLSGVLAPMGTSAQGNSSAAPLQSVTVANVNANPANNVDGSVWTDTGVTLTAGVPVTITASGSVYRANSTDVYWSNTPEGIPSTTCGVCTATYLPMYSLIGRIGTGDPFLVGTGPITVSGEGRLYLAFNDGQYSDNSGYFVATISYACMPGKGIGDNNHMHCGAPGQN